MILRTHPGVEVVYPLRRSGGRLAPFPTIYWLTDPRLDHAVADLERRGAVAAVEAAIRADGALLARFREDHRRYIEQRWTMLTAADRRVVEASPVLLRVFRDRGVGGTADWSTVKCLHAHVAHHLVDRNTAAEVLVERYGLAL